MSRVFDPIQLGSIEQFCRAAELLSFRAAAEALGLTPAAVSRSIARLEARLGVRLFVRTTRRINLTADGRLYYEQCRQALAQIEEAERALTGRQSTPRGLLRMSLPTTYGHYRVLPLLPRFRAKYPDVQIEVSLSNRNIDFVEEGYDLAVRLDAPPDTRLVARKLEDATLGVFASSAYLKRRGAPERLEDLARHDCIQFIRPSTGRPMAWIFRDDGRDLDFAFDGPLRIADDVLGAVTCARAGAGLFQIYHFIAAEAVARGELVEVLHAYAGRSRPFSVLFPQNRHLSARVRAFVDFLVAKLAP
ncbi:MAG: LysR family transcriptional regulator [Burkholderiales bacterium]|jgi:DNA-binding transcriptional LysR family regulator|nr:LysR family transcriptional regulator [Burkholderiales bacterium]